MLISDFLQNKQYLDSQHLPERMVAVEPWAVCAMATLRTESNRLDTGTLAPSAAETLPRCTARTARAVKTQP